MTTTTINGKASIGGCEGGGSPAGTGPTQKVAAFFDFDQTILSTDCAGKEAEGFWDLSYKERQYWLFAKLTFFALVIVKLYSIHVIIDGERINRLYYFLCYKNMVYDDLVENAKRLYEDGLRHKLFPDILQLMQSHHRQGHLVYVVSASPTHLIRPFVDDPQYKEWITGLVSTEIGVDSEGRCTGRTKFGKVCIGHQKSIVQRKLSKDMNIDLRKSYAYSDHHHDLEFLEAVGTPIVVNPTKQLQTIAKKRHWKKIEVTMPVTPSSSDSQKDQMIDSKKQE